MTRLITTNELKNLKLEELRGLYRKIFNDLVQSPPESLEQTNAQASLENIRREICHRLLP